ncbi:MAG: 1-acyl-sn-glycerol-3-phosphate acyltransferase [Bacteroidota bacterium]|nr:1-acyl-sn-glycerol-3-phosphate acyltransferase [Bacteroidota bacterium]
MPGTPPGICMLYYFAKLMMSVALRMFYRHVHVTGFHHIPEKGPVIIIANHQSSLMDAALIGILLKRKAWFFARGDVFINRPVRQLLRWLHMLPVHGHIRGKNTRDVNESSFEAGKAILRKGGIIVFFPESTSHVERELYAFRKGVFRLGFDAAVNGSQPIDIPVVPIGITYDHPTRANTGVQVHAGEAMALSDYQQDYASNPAQALLRISRDAWYRVESLMLHIGNPDRFETAEQRLTIDRTDHEYGSHPWRIQDTHKLQREQAICRGLLNESEEVYAEKKIAGDAYFGLLKKNEISDEVVINEKTQPGKTVLLWLLAPFAVAGIVLNAFPFVLGRYVADKKVFRPDFYSWIHVVGCALFYCMWVLLITLLTGLMSWWLSLALLVGMVISGLIARYWLLTRRAQRARAGWNALAPETRGELKAKRLAVVKSFRP